MYFTTSNGQSSSSLFTAADFKYRMLKLRRWWAMSSGLRKWSLTFVALIFFLFVSLFSLFWTCFNKTDTAQRHDASFISDSQKVGSDNEQIDNHVTRRKLEQRSTSPGTFKISYTQYGRVFYERGKSFMNVSAAVSTSMVYSYSPEVEEFFSESIYDPFDENRYVGLGPAILENDDGTLLSVQRIWLSHYDVLYSKDPDIKTKNTWQENFLYARTYDANWQPLERGRVLGIPSSTNCAYAYRSDGPMDPRLFLWNNTKFLSFHLWQFDADQADIRGRMFFWNYEKNQLFKLKVPEGFKDRLQRTEINWLPITLNNELYYIYSFDPFRVFKCSARGECTYAQWPKGEEKVPFDSAQDVLRGGSPFVLYKWPYYIAVGHSQVATHDDKLLYSANIVVISVHPHFRLVYVSAPIQVKEQLMSSARITRHYTILRPFLFPVGAILRSPDVLDFSAHLSDTRGYVFRLHGMEKLMNSVMDADQSINKQNPSWSMSIDPVRFRLAHWLAAKDLAVYHRISRLQYPEIVDNKH